MAVSRIRGGLEELQRDAALRERIIQEAVAIFAKKRAKDGGEKFGGLEVSGAIVDELSPFEVSEVDPELHRRLDRLPLRTEVRISSEEIRVYSLKGNADKLISSAIEKAIDQVAGKTASICRGCELAKVQTHDEKDYLDQSTRIKVDVRCAAPRCAKDERRPIRIHETGRVTRAKNYTMPAPEPVPDPPPRTTYGDW